VEHYCSVRPVTKDAKRQAEDLDRFLGQKMREIETELKKAGLLRRKGKNDVLPLWHALGSRLTFVDDPSVVPSEDRVENRYIWEAIWHHAGNLAPGDPNKNTGKDRDHFRMCYRLARKGPLERVAAIGTWRDWVDLLESPFLKDHRIEDWIGEKMRESPKHFLRKLTPRLRAEFKDVETEGFYSDDELLEVLEACWRDVFSAH
jgi:hypothetical protein